VRRSLRYVLFPGADDAAQRARDLVDDVAVSDAPDWLGIGDTLPEHVTITFAQAVRGPLAIGRDRHHGHDLLVPQRRLPGIERGEHDLRIGTFLEACEALGLSATLLFADAERRWLLGEDAGDVARPDVGGARKP
jgi:hypothetical protein